VVATLIRLRRLPAPRPATQSCSPAALALFSFRWRLSIAAYVRGVTGDLSAATLVLAGAAASAAHRETLIGQRDLRALCGYVARVPVPFRAGWNALDPYS